MDREMAKTYLKRLGCIISFLLLCTYGYAGEIGKVTYIEGRADVLRGNAHIVVPLRGEEAVSVGDVLRTKSNSKVEVTFNDRTILRLAQNSRVEIEDYQLDENSRRKTATVNLQRGKIRTIIEKMTAKADFNIHTPNAQGTITGSDVYAFYQAGNSGMLVAAGNLSIVNTAFPEKSLMIPPGNSVVVHMEELPKGPRTYFELERKFHEQDTSPPPSIARTKDTTIIRGAVTAVFGEVTITTRNQNRPHKATINEVVGEGDRIITGEDGMIEIKFDNGNGLNLKPNTNLVVVKLLINPKTEEYENLFEVASGKVRARIEKLKGASSFTVRTPTAISGARGTIMYLEVSSDI
ncbi:FecR domain-containing protein, partial [Candidatus Omnitrophota bacterium]